MQAGPAQGPLNQVYHLWGKVTQVSDHDIGIAVRWGATSDSLLAHGYTININSISSHSLRAGGVDIAIALAPSSSSIVVESPSRRPSPSSCRRAVHRHCATPSIAVNSPSRRPSPPIRCALGLSPLHLRCPLPSRSHHAVHGRRGAVLP